MRPITEAFLRANAANLTQKGWRPDEQSRCFRKTDALLDYIGHIKPSEYKRTGWCFQLNNQRAEGFRYCLEKGMSSQKMRGRCLGTLSQLLSIGEELLIKAAWLYQNHPALFKEKYALSKQDFEKDAHFYFVRGHVVPENAFPPFKTGENPVLSRNNSFLEKCVEMYNDPLFGTPDFKAFSAQSLNKKYPYSQWIKKHKAGRRFLEENCALRHVIEHLAIENEMSLKIDKAQLVVQALQKKQKA